MEKNSKIKMAVATGSLVLAGAWLLSFVAGPGGSGEGKIYFYDLSERKLFAGPRDAVPPVKGVNDGDLDAVRAIVVTATGDPREKKNVNIAYLEKYTPELKAQLEALRKAEAAGQSTVGMLAHGAIPKNTLVRRPGEANWVPMTSPAGEAIVSEWNRPGADGKYPVICVP
jgi:hypothetical protein